MISATKITNIFHSAKNKGPKNPLSMRKADFSIIYTKINALSDDDFASADDVQSFS